MTIRRTSKTKDGFSILIDFNRHDRASRGCLSLALFVHVNEAKKHVCPRGITRTIGFASCAEGGVTTPARNFI
jgi:hypothetical protein